jgi:hypothetical protein
LFFKKVISFFYPLLKNIKDKQVMSESINQYEEAQIMSEPIKQYEDDLVISESNKQYDLKVPSNLRPVERIFLRPFLGVYYDENDNLFYSTRTARRTRTFCPIKWTYIKYVYSRGNKEGPRFTKKIYKYVTLPVCDGNFFRLSEKEWDDWVRVNKANNSKL